MKYETVSQIIEALGGQASISRELEYYEKGVLTNLGASTIGAWKAHRSIRVKYWPALMELAKRKKVRLRNDDLVLVHELERIET